MHWTNWLLTVFILLLLSFAYSNVDGADLSLKDKVGSVLILHDSKCDSKKVLYVMTYRKLPTKGMKNAEFFSVSKGATKGCWDANPKTGQIFLLFENGMWSTSFYLHQFGEEGKELRPRSGQQSKHHTNKKQFFAELARDTANDGYITSNSNGSNKPGR